MYDHAVASPVHPRYRLSRQHSRLAALLAVAGVLSLALAGMLTYERPSCDEVLGRIEGAVKESLVRLTETSPRDAASELSTTRRQLHRRDDQLQQLIRRVNTLALSDAQLDRAEFVRDELARLRTRSDQWDEVLRLTPTERREDVWVGILVEVLAERRRWPLAGLVRRSSAPKYRDLWREFTQGVRAGALWPVHAVLRGASRSASSQGILRRMLFPHNKGTVFNLSRLLGFGLSAIGIGYAFCWLGMRRSLAWSSYAGLLYFLYVIVFASCLLYLKTGLLT